jgi:glycosyltransferase involved in cell wall biosynthesis
VKHRILVTTLPPYEGGVPAKTRLLCEHLRALGHQVTVAWYATRSEHPELCVAAWQVPGGRAPRTQQMPCFSNFPGVAVGSWLPELEAPYYLPSRRWNALIQSHTRHLAVGGNPLVSYPLLHAGVPHFVWFASRMLEDRLDRQHAMPISRRIYDRLVVVPALQRLERTIMSGGSLLVPVSHHTYNCLLKAGRPAATLARLPIPVDTARYSPSPLSQDAPVGVVGFAGRLADPRKNVGLLLEAVAEARRSGVLLELRLAGSDPPPEMVRRAKALGLEAAVRFLGKLPHPQLPDFYRSLDVFAIPSFQEGFGIVGVEALACGVPVVSTRCGGPEEFVIQDETGLLVDAEPSGFARALITVAMDRPRRAALSRQARHLALRNYDSSQFRAGLSDVWRRVWNEEL